MKLSQFQLRGEAPLILWVVPVVIAIVTPGLTWLVAERPLAARTELGIGITTIVLIVALGLLAVLSRGFQQRLRWALSVTAVATLALFQWPTLTFAGKVIRYLTKLSLLGDVVPVLISIALLWLATRLGDEWLFPAVVGLGTTVVVVVLAITAVKYVELAPTNPRGTAAADAPDVVLLILDGYVRADVLADQFDHDNGPFLDGLRSLGFQIADEAQANYSFTYAALSAMFDQDYVYDLGPVVVEEHAAARNALSGNPVMFDRFRAAGYEIAFTENAWQGSHCGAAVDICIRDGFMQTVLWDASQTTILAPVVKNFQANPFNTVSMEHLESLPSYIADDRIDGVPRLIVAHVILPHPPFLRDAECNYVTSSVRRAFTTPSEELIANRRDYYTEQMTCTNEKVLATLGEILAERPDTIVMITGDHGSGSTQLANADSSEWSDEGIAERMSILSAYRVPGCENNLYSTITPVNGSRLISACAIGDDANLLPDNSWWVPATGRGSVVDVSDRLDR